MVRITELEREALRLAAVAAVPVLSKLKEEQADLAERISRFEKIIVAYEESIGKRPRRADDQDATKPRRGQVGEHVDAILSSGSDYREPELRREMWTRFGIKYSRGTVYTTLKRGEGKRYEQKEKRWRIKVG